jgi:zinc transporter, ZIP family
MSIQDLTSTILTSGFSQSIVLGILVASAFPIGVAISSGRKFPRQVKGNLAAIAAGIYFSTLAFSLVEEAIKISSFPAMAAGFVTGAITFSIMHPIVKERRELTKLFSRSSSGKKEEVEEEETADGSKGKQLDDSSSSGKMNIVGTILDSVPENLFIGAIIALNLSGLHAALIALFLGNLTATMDGAQRMFDKGMQRSKIFKKWLVDFIIVAPAGIIGWYLVKPLGEGVVGGIIGFGAGALLVFVTVDLIPKAYREENWHIGLSTTLGLIAVLAIFHYLG